MNKTRARVITVASAGMVGALVGAPLISSATTPDTGAAGRPVHRRDHRPRSRPMISFMISVVPPYRRVTRASAYALATGYSVM